MKRAWMIATVAGMVWTMMVPQRVLGEDPAPPLAFYIVQEAKGDGPARFIDMPAFPKLGYIATKADLVISRLQEVKADVSIQRDGHMEKHGKLVFEPTREVPSIKLNLYPEDATKLTEITGRAVHKRLLLMVGETPLMAPWVNERIATSSLQVSFGSEQEQGKNEEIIRMLKKLVPH